MAAYVVASTSKAPGEQAREPVALGRRQRELERPQRRLEVLRTPRAEHDGVDPRVGEEPGECERRAVDAARRRLGAEAVEGVVDAVRLEVAVGLRPQRHARALGRRLAAAVLPGQPAAGERAERLEGDGQVEDRLGVPVEERVRVLHGRDRCELERAARLLCVDVREPERRDEPFVSERRELRRACPRAASRDPARE